MKADTLKFLQENEGSFIRLSYDRETRSYVIEADIVDLPSFRYVRIAGRSHIVNRVDSFDEQMDVAAKKAVEMEEMYQLMLEYEADHNGI